jgi:hypothetical protein
MMSLIKFVVFRMFAGVVPMYFGFGANPASKTFKGVEAGDQAIAGQTGGQAAAESAQLNPFFSQEMRATHSLTPEQQNQMLTAAEAGSGGTFGGAEGQINRDAARTGNATSITKSLDEMARDKAKANAGASEGIAAQDAAGVNALHEAGAAGMQGLYGTNINAQLNAMKGTTEAAQADMAANPGALSKIEGILNTASNAAGTAMKGYQMAQPQP